MSRREGQLKAEFQDWFPHLAAGVWYPAAELASHVLAQLRCGEPRWEPGDRIPSDSHFIFRGEDDTRAPGRRTRRTDPAGGVP
jgi:hypothetical protein